MGIMRVVLIGIFRARRWYAHMPVRPLLPQPHVNDHTEHLYRRLQGGHDRAEGGSTREGGYGRTLP
jgi:hypothetical protein